MKQQDTLKQLEALALNDVITHKDFKNIVNLSDYIQTIKSYKIRPLLKVLKIIYEKIYTNQATLDVRYSVDIRTPLKHRFGIESKEYILSKKITALSYADKGTLITQAKETLIKKHESPVQYDQLDILKKIKDYSRSDLLNERIVALLLSSGSRPCELLELSIYEPVDDTFIKQTGIAKKRTEKENAFVIKPLIGLSTAEFMNVFQSIPRLKTSSQLNSSLNKVGVLGDLPLYTCRKLYAAISYELYGSAVTKSLWFSRILGHAATDLNTQNNYNLFVPKK